MLASPRQAIASAQASVQAVLSGRGRDIEVQTSPRQGNVEPIRPAELQTKKPDVHATSLCQQQDKDWTTGSSSANTANTSTAVAVSRSDSKDSFTPSLKDLLDHGPDLVAVGSYREALLVHFRRLFTDDLATVKIFESEKKTLLEGMHLGNKAAQYVAWRSSLIWSGSFFFALIVGLETVFTIGPWNNKGAESFYMRPVDPRYRDFFSGLNTLNWIQSICLMLASIIAAICAVVAAYKYKEMRLSRHCIFFSWMFSILPPFVLLLLLPFRNSVHFEGIQVQMCKDLLGLTRSLEARGANFAGQQVQNLVTSATGTSATTGYWPGKVGHLAQQIYDAYRVELPSGFCDGRPTDWGPTIRRLMEDGGYLARADGTCGFSDRALVKLNVTAEITGDQIHLPGVTMSVAINNSVCPEVCRNCTTACQPHLMRLAALASIHGADLVRTVPLGGVAESCTHCVSKNALLQCPFRCPAISAALDKQAVLGVVPLPGCGQPEEFSDFEVLLQLGVQTAHWKMLLGTMYGAVSLAMLMPLAFSLMLGASKGAAVAKSLIPYSRVPTVVSMGAAVFTLPFVTIIAILMQTMLGNVLTLVGILFILVAFVAAMKPGSLKAERTAELKRRHVRLSRIKMGCLTVALLLFFVVAFSSDLAYACGKLLKDQQLELSSDDHEALRSQVTWMLVSGICSVFGKSLISTTFFTDNVVTLMWHFHKGEDEDVFSVQCAQGKLVEDLTSLYPHPGVASVAPDDCGHELNGGQDVTVSQLMGQQQAMLTARIQRLNTDSNRANIEQLEKVKQQAAARLGGHKVGSGRVFLKT